MAFQPDELRLGFKPVGGKWRVRVDLWGQGKQLLKLSASGPVDRDTKKYLIQAYQQLARSLNITCTLPIRKEDHRDP